MLQHPSHFVVLAVHSLHQPSDVAPSIPFRHAGCPFHLVAPTLRCNGDHVAPSILSWSIPCCTVPFLFNSSSRCNNISMLHHPSHFVMPAVHPISLHQQCHQPSDVAPSIPFRCAGCPSHRAAPAIIVAPSHLFSTAHLVAPMFRCCTIHPICLCQLSIPSCCTGHDCCTIPFIYACCPFNFVAPATTVAPSVPSILCQLFIPSCCTNPPM
jgi:hypothetical protein